MKRQKRTENYKEQEEQTVPPRAEILSPQYYDAVIFELDGVIANTVKLHFEAYKKVFDTFLLARYGRDFKPFTRNEFRQFVDGKPREEAILSFLDARGARLPLGEELPAADEALQNRTDTVYGLSKMKQENFRKRIESGYLQLQPGIGELLHKLVRAGMKTAAVSPSEMTHRVMGILDLEPLFDVVVDGADLAEGGLAGKPGIDIFVEAITRLEVTADRAAIIEDDRPTVEAGRGTGFGLIVVVAGRDGETKKKFLRRGADLAVEELTDLKVTNEEGTLIQ